MKQRSFEDSIGISFVLIDADLLLIWMNKFQLWFRFRRELCPVLPAVLIINNFVRGVYVTASGYTCINPLPNLVVSQSLPFVCIIVVILRAFRNRTCPVLPEE